MNVFNVRHRNVIRYCVVAVVGVAIVAWVRSWLSLPAGGWVGPRGPGALDHQPARPEDFKQSGASLTMADKHFYLKGQQVELWSGAMHYFRVVPEYWRDRMLKMKAAGLNTLETYVAWNIHEPEKGRFVFEGMYNLRKYIMLAQQLGLWVIVRPGPYICAEWDLGGLPSWLLADPDMQLRSSYGPYLEAVDKYMEQVAKQIADLQHSRGGPIIAFQIENEYGSYGNNKEYIIKLREMFLKYELRELHFTSDNDQGVDHGSIKGVMTMSNMGSLEMGQMVMSFLRKLQPSLPQMVMEYWVGWFDHWGETHHSVPIHDMETMIKFILAEAGNINFYMFHGGTSFGFMNGANYPYAPTITSYDYDAPLSEAGDMTLKWVKIREILLSKVKGHVQALVPPHNGTKFAYGMVQMKSYMTLESMLTLIKPVKSKTVVPMEMLDINSGGGQGHGFILYRKVTPPMRHLQIIGKVSDRAQIIIDGHEKGVLDWHADNPTVEIKDQKMTAGQVTMDILVENLGRINYDHYKARQMDGQRKGLNKEVRADGKTLVNWDIYPLEFKPSFIKTLLTSESLWKPVDDKVLADTRSPAIYRGKLTILGKPKDTFVLTKGWSKGVVFINSFNLGRYWKLGPQQTLYLPGPLLRAGDNEILVFELHEPISTLSFIERPILG